MAMTIQQVVDTLLAAVPVSRLPRTVDTIKMGDPSQRVTRIISTFMPTLEVIDRAIDLKANLIICHEPLFYNHPDEVEWLRDQALYEAKCRKIEENNLVIWRFHDYLHRMQPDPTVAGLLKAFGWEGYVVPENASCCRIPPVTLRQLAAHIKSQLGSQNLRVVGNLDITCQGIGILPGFAGKERQIEMLKQPDMDAIICGETHEWETSEYVRDAAYLRHNKALIILGHAESEEPGMKWIIPWIQQHVPGIPVDFVANSKLFQWL